MSQSQAEDLNTLHNRCNDFEKRIAALEKAVGGIVVDEVRKEIAAIHEHLDATDANVAEAHARVEAVEYQVTSPVEDAVHTPQEHPPETATLPEDDPAVEDEPAVEETRSNKRRHK